MIGSFRRSCRPLALAVWVTAAAFATCASAAVAEGRCGEHPWCNTSLPAEERATLLLHAMSQSDKIGVLTEPITRTLDLNDNGVVKQPKPMSRRMLKKAERRCSP